MSADALNGRTFLAGAAIAAKTYTFTRPDADTTTDYTDAVITLEFYRSDDELPAVTIDIGNGLTRAVNNADVQSGSLTVSEAQVNLLLGSATRQAIGYVWTITPVGYAPIRASDGDGYDGTFILAEEGSVVIDDGTAWKGIYTNSDYVAEMLGGRMLVPGYPNNEKFGWSGPLLDKDLVTRIGTSVEAEIDAILASTGHKLPLRFRTPANRQILRLLATKSICCELFRATPNYRQRTGNIGDEDLEAIQELVEDDYCLAMEKFREQMQRSPLFGEDLADGGSSTSLAVAVSRSRRGKAETTLRAEEIQWGFPAEPRSRHRRT